MGVSIYAPGRFPAYLLHIFFNDIKTKISILNKVDEEQFGDEKTFFL